MIDEDRLRGLSEEEIVELLESTTPSPIDELDHPIALLDGFENLLKAKFDPSNFTGNENYFIGGMSPYVYVGNEAGFWDNIKESSKVLYDTLKKAITQITSYFTGDGSKQIDDAQEKLSKALDGMKQINGAIPVPENSSLLSKEKYFKEPKVDGLDEDDLSVVNKAISDLNSAIGKLDSVKDVTSLTAALSAIGNASISASKAVTEQIKKDASEASKAVNDIQNPDIPKDDENQEVKNAKKEKIQDLIKDAKAKGTEIKRIASLRNKFLAPALVVAASLPGVEKLKENKEFKG